MYIRYICGTLLIYGKIKKPMASLDQNPTCSPHDLVSIGEHSPDKGCTRFLRGICETARHHYIFLTVRNLACKIWLIQACRHKISHKILAGMA